MEVEADVDGGKKGEKEEGDDGILQLMDVGLDGIEGGPAARRA